MTSSSLQGRAALLVHNFPPGTQFAWGFIGQLMNAAMQNFARAGLTVLTSFPDAEARPTQPDATSISVVWDPGNPTLQSQWRILQLIRAYRIRVIYLVDQPLLRPAYALWKLAGVQCIIVHDHTSGTRPPLTALRRAIKRAAWSIPGLGADLVIGVSAFVVERLRSVGCVPESRLALVRNGVPIPDGAAAEPPLEASPDSGALQVIAIARATPVKGIDVLIRAWRLVIDRWPAASVSPKLLYAGDGPMMTDLKDIVSDLNLWAHVEFLGYQNDVANVFRRADICVVPSVWEEAFCLVAAEAMSCGVPVIASDAGAIPEVLGHDGVGRLVPPGNVHALADALTEMLRLPQSERQAMGLRGRKRASEELSLHRTFEVFDDVLSNVVVPISKAAT